MTLASLPDWLAGSPLSGRLPLRTLCLALLLWLLPTCVMAAPGSIRACMENSDSPPWLLMSGEGIVQFHLKEVANRIGHPIILTPLPWKRCLSLVSQGQLDAAVKLSYSEERARTIGVYPMRHGAPDPAKRCSPRATASTSQKADRFAGMAGSSSPMASLRRNPASPSSPSCRRAVSGWMTPAGNH